jgi:S1-C subfamily serine protease
MKVLRRYFLAASLAAVSLLLAASPASAQSWKLGVRIVSNLGGGAAIVEVFSGSPAEQIGLQPGMVIITVDGRIIHDIYAMRNYIMTPGRNAIDIVFQDGVDFYQVTADLAVVTTYTKQGKAYSKAQVRNIQKKKVGDPRQDKRPHDSHGRKKVADPRKKP